MPEGLEHATPAAPMRLLARIYAEYLEMPGLSLTESQMQRLWGLDGATCSTVVQILVGAHVLKRTERDTYVLIDAGA